MSEITIETLLKQRKQYSIGKDNLVERQRFLTAELQQIVANINATEGAMQACDLLIQQLQNENGAGDCVAPADEYQTEHKDLA